MPFLNQDLVEYAICLKKESVHSGRSDKAVVRMAFEGLLPEHITHRPKLAFQDGMGLKKEIQAVLGNPQKFYKECFDREYGGNEDMEEAG